MIRPECLRPYDQNWSQPTGTEIREVLRLACLSGSEAAKVLGLGSQGGGRTVRRWISEDSAIPYASWALLCDFAGLGIIWRHV
ncbi:MAG: transcriptional regulator [Methylomonas lenta]|nr:transcriptional regulator [Methylomonas lenta]